jgi:hypothetical protein
VGASVDGLHNVVSNFESLVGTIVARPLDDLLVVNIFSLVDIQAQSIVAQWRPVMVFTRAVSEGLIFSSFASVSGINHYKICTSIFAVVLNGKCPVRVLESVDSAVSWVEEPELSCGIISGLADFY